MFEVVGGRANAEEGGCQEAGRQGTTWQFHERTGHDRGHNRRRHKGLTTSGVAPIRTASRASSRQSRRGASRAIQARPTGVGSPRHEAMEDGKQVSPVWFGPGLVFMHGHRGYSAVPHRCRDAARRGRAWSTRRATTSRAAFWFDRAAGALSACTTRPMRPPPPGSIPRRRPGRPTSTPSCPARPIASNASAASMPAT